ncbi:insulinase family protein [Eggerthella sinensis]|uniref:Peptidase M16 n=1 Tax=Eggerthella sinensis TaxID=242230 RepID=A0A3N0IVS6_9ACTN|nr:insulinase family protein [Eggerthella sinensis]RDB70752.1 peptidase M16 [Eggerthella sinensis]RNM41101.1 peptidase M16 [Eggerthella sinensis]
MDLTPGSQLHGFTVRSSEPLSEIDGTAYVLDHDKSGAQLLYLANDDTNKAFSIAFKTPPADDTGVFHILEHSVLCGSDKFPVKEPFVNLLKSSMQTFLNAMTFPDKTMYPVASTNDQDLLNLTDVYLDAVLHPAIYRKRAIFEQEGWHYELSGDVEAAAGDSVAGDAVAATEAADGSASLVLNGVVYNEMKGALSDPNSVLYDELQAALFPDTAYRFESGGTPRAIPDLTYEQFLEEHRRHYRLDNSYLTLYGDLDADAMLAFLDERYLSPVADEQAAATSFDAEGAPLAPHPLEKQAPVVALGVTRNMVTAPENACAGLGYVIGDAGERTRIVAVDILLDAIMGSNEAPLKRALLDAGLAADAQAFLADSVLQPFAVMQLRGLEDDGAARFRTVVEENLRALADGGLDRTLVEASLSRAEFVMRERDFGMSDGVALAMSALAGWLYDDDAATSYLKYEDDFAFLRSALEEGYFEQLIREVFLESTHLAEVEIVPVDGDEDAYEEARLSAAEASMAPEDFVRVADEEAALRRLQEEPDAPEALATLPRLSVADIGAAPVEPPYALVEDAPVPTLRHDAPTRGIAYAYRYFDLDRVAFDELPYVTVLGLVLGKLGTARHTASELDTLVNGKLGNLTFFAEIYEDAADPSVLAPKFVVSSSALTENVRELAELPREIMLETDFSDASKIKDVLQQRRIGMEQGFANAGHASAMAHLASYYLPAGVVREQLGGVGFYRFLKKLLASWDERADDVVARLADLAQRLFADDALILSFTGSDEDYERFWAAGGALERTGTGEALLKVPAPVKRNEAFIVPTDVCYAALGFDRRAFDADYTGAWQVAARALSYDYLWNEVRVKGGAYGAGFQTARTGNLRFYSYRDPHLDETLERFAGASAWLAAFDPADDEMEGYVVSTVAGFDTPLKARGLVRRQDGDFFGGRTPESRLETRTQMIETSAEQLRGLARPIARAVEENDVCVFGNRDIIEASSADLDVVDLLNE